MTSALQYLDDSSGTVGDDLQWLMGLYARACTAAPPAPKSLAGWLVKLEFDGPGWPRILLPEFAVALGARGGIITHRQRPATAGGITFTNVEDETGMLNVTCSPALWQRFRKVTRNSSALIVRGRLERHDGVINLTADRLDEITPPVLPTARDFG